MTQPEPIAAIDLNHRSLRRLFDCYLLFIVYASFIPFLFNFDPNFIQWRLDIFFSRSFYRGVQRWSGSDVVTNVLIYIPLGVLLAGSWRHSHLSSRSPMAPLIIGIAGLLLGFTIELGQTLSPFRSPSMLDAFCNGLGTFVGALLSYPLFPALKGGLGRQIVTCIRRQPIVLLFAFALLAPIVTAYYPFEFNLRAKSIVDNLRHSHLHIVAIPSSMWVELFFEQAVSFAVMAYLLVAQIERNRPSTNASFTLAYCAALAFVIEAGKIFFKWHSFDATRWLFALTGGALGAAIAQRWPFSQLTTRRGNLILVYFAVALLGYFQLEPFDWISPGELRWKIYQIEWLPFTSYFWSDPRDAFFDLLKKLYLSIPIGFLLSTAWPNKNCRRYDRATVMLVFLSLSVETAQLVVRSRTTSVTDVMTIAIGGWIGVQIYRLYRSSGTLNEIPSASV